MGWRIGNLLNPIVVEEDKHTTRRSENGIPIAPQYCPRVVTLDALPAVQVNRKGLEWPARHQRIKDYLEMVCGHFSSFPFLSTYDCFHFLQILISNIVASLHNDCGAYFGAREAAIRPVQ
jgi:hypothetical protein